MCHLCDRESKDVFHALWGCEKLHSIWSSDFSWVDRSRVTSGTFSEVMKVIQEWPQSVALFVATAWSIWYHWNKNCLQQSSLPLVKIPGFARDYVRDFIKLTRCSPSIQCQPSKKWCPPKPDLAKINFDGAMFNKWDEVGIGVIIRNPKGKVMATLSEKDQKTTYYWNSGATCYKEGYAFLPRNEVPQIYLWRRLGVSDQISEVGRFWKLTRWPSH